MLGLEEVLLSSISEKSLAIVVCSVGVLTDVRRGPNALPFVEEACDEAVTYAALALNPRVGRAKISNLLFTPIQMINLLA